MENDTLERLRAAAPEAFEATPVLFAYVFGSTATGRTMPSSDIDVAVFVGMEVAGDDRLELALGLSRRLADSSGLGHIDLLIVNSAPLPLRGRVVRDRAVIYSRDEPSRVAFEARTLTEFLDFEIHARPLNDALLRAIGEGRR